MAEALLTSGDEYESVVSSGSGGTPSPSGSGSISIGSAGGGGIRIGNTSGLSGLSTSLGTGTTAGTGASAQFLRSLLKCANCRTTCVKIPIYQCQREGHLICSSCYSFWFPHCNGCDVSFFEKTKIKTRNRVAEAILGEIDLRCPYRGSGCEKIMKHKELVSHAADCPFRINLLCYNMARCELRLKDKFNFSKSCPAFSATDNVNLIRHLKSEHGLMGTTTGKLEYTLDDELIQFGFGRSYDYLHYTLVGQRLFVLKTKLNWVKKEISWKVLFMGSVKTAKEYRVRIGIVFQPLSTSDKADTFGNETRRCKVEWEGGPFGFYAGWKRKSSQKFELPWSTFQAQRKRLESEILTWHVQLEITKRTSESGIHGNPPPYEASFEVAPDSSS